MMIFKNMLTTLWQYFDLICFIIGSVFANLFAYTFGNRWLMLSLAITFVLFGYASEVIYQLQKGGD